jgi:hypothetical protein
MSKIHDAWDALPPDGEHGSLTPEIAALRALWGKSAFRMLNDMEQKWTLGGNEIPLVKAVQRFVAEAYLYAKGALASQPTDTIPVPLSAEDFDLISDALGVLSSDYNDVDHDAIAELRDRLKRARSKT